MGLFSKLFGNEVAKEMLNDLGKAFSVSGNNNDQNRQEEETAQSSVVTIYDNVPAEENQYNFRGDYIEYFNKVFREDFPEYEISHEKSSLNRTSTIFTFRFNGNAVLYVELMTKNSSANRFREQCKREGTPYLRFYYDKRGWWNTRKYVTDRTRNALC